ncbi:MAG TPA: class I SAM-dependent methyltransferase [Fimbriimonadales bacterium]|nr:class I SAM-dependent methyltransferase [Fimbriimonadales bacterium]
MSSFIEIPEYYEELMSGVPYPMWVEYLKLLWANFDVNPRTVLDVCCGTGKMCRLLAEQGYEMTGVDLSAGMIRAGQGIARREKADINLYAQDATEMRLGKKFDAAFSFFDSLNYIIDPSQCALAIKRTAEHLNSGAAFAFDVNTPYAFEKQMFDQEDLRPKSKVRYRWRGTWDPGAKLCSVAMEFWVGKKTFSEVHVQRAHSLQELVCWMEEAGFERVRCYDAFSLDPPRGRSDRVHVVGVVGHP